MAKPLYERTKKEAKWEWGEKEQQAFHRLKEALSTTPVLTHFDPEKPIQIETDASKYVCSGILSQQCEDGKWRPVAYRSKTMTKAECNYDVHDKELLAVVQALKEWRRYAKGSKHRIRILTDHKNLVPFMTTKVLNGRQIRWSQELAQFNFKIEYRPGKQGGKPDALTRREGDIPDKKEQKFEQQLLPEGTFELEELVLDEFQDKDKGLETILQKTKKDEQIQEIKKALQRGDKEMKKVALGLCQWKNEMLWYQGKIWIPEDEGLRTHLIHENHDTTLAGHGGTAKTTELVSRRYYWPKIRETIKRYVKNCDTCQRTKVVRHAPYGLLQPNEAPDRPWKSIAMDFITDLPKSEGYDTILVVIDRLTKMSHFIPCKKELNARQFAKLFMKEVVRLHGLPQDIITDRGTLFTSDLWKEVTRQTGIERRMSTAFHPQTDGQTERTNGILEQYLRAYINYQQDNWCDLLPLAEFAYNNGHQETIKTSPFYANYGIHPEYKMIGHLTETTKIKTDEMSELHDTLRQEMVAAQLRQKEIYDQHRKPDPNLQSGDMVWLLPRHIRTTRPSKKLDYKKLGPFKILAKVGTSAYKLELPASMKQHNNFHISLLEPYQDNRFPSQIQVPPPPIEIEGETEYELEEIIDSRRFRNQLQYRAKWTGYPPQHDQEWYPATNFNNAQHAISRFHQRYPNKPGIHQRRNLQLCASSTNQGRGMGPRGPETRAIPAH
jgi:transposase InsO family protein